MVEIAELPMRHEEWLPEAMGIGTGVFGTVFAQNELDKAIETYAGGDVMTKLLSRFAIGGIDSWIMANSFSRVDHYENALFYGALASGVVTLVNTVGFALTELGLSDHLFGQKSTHPPGTKSPPSTAAQIMKTTSTPSKKGYMRPYSS